MGAMNLGTLTLCGLSSAAGLVMVVGGIWLLYKQKIYIDSESKTVTSIELPLVGKLKTSSPVLALFMLGFVPLIYPVSKVYDLGEQARQEIEKAHQETKKVRDQLRQQLRLTGKVDGVRDAFPVEVLAVIGTQNVHDPGEFGLRIPQVAATEGEVKILYVLPDGRKLDGLLLEQTKNELRFQERRILSAAKRPAGRGRIEPVSDEFPTDDRQRGS